MHKQSVDESPGAPAREHLAKSEFAMPKSAPHGHPEEHGKYPVPDKVHARAALGFAAMHHGKGSSEYQAVAAKVHHKFPDMSKKAFVMGFVDRALESGLLVTDVSDLVDRFHE